MHRLNEPLDPDAHQDLRSLLKKVGDLDESGNDIPEDVARDFLDTAVMTSWLQIRRTGIDDRECLVILRDRLDKSFNQMKAVIDVIDGAPPGTSEK
jgi:hypothetical protein